MAYTDTNFKTKSALKAALAEGKKIGVYAPGLGSIDPNGKVTLEGPHYPQPHRWYAEGWMKDGLLVKIK